MPIIHAVQGWTWRCEEKTKEDELVEERKSKDKSRKMKRENRGAVRRRVLHKRERERCRARAWTTPALAAP